MNWYKNYKNEWKQIKNSIFIDELTKDEINYELLKGINDIEKGNVKSSDVVDEILKERLGIQSFTYTKTSDNE